jgi:HTH-type transcriptional regulator/antitoxin HigA
MTLPSNPEAFAPGDYIREELEVREWSQLDLAEILGRPAQAVNEIIAGKRSITPDTAKALGDAFGTSAQLWMNLDSAYQLAQLSEQTDAVARKAKLYEIAPLKEMQKRGWIETSSSVDILEGQVLNFFGIKALDEPIQLRHAARKSTDYGSLTSPQLVWLCRARNLAPAVPATGRFSARALEKAFSELAKLKAEPEEIRHVPKVLADAGIRFLVVAPLPHTKIDGVTFWLANDQPVIALSFRYDRIDWFWHTLVHEMGHVKRGEGKQNPTVDTQLVGADAQRYEDKHESEREADRFAVAFLVNQSELDGFIARVHPLYSKLKISAFAKRLSVHPGIVVGQLQYRGKIPYAHSRDLLVTVKKIVASAALTDGWGDAVLIRGA